MNKTEKTFELASMMRAAYYGVSLEDIMHAFECSRRAAERLRDEVRAQFPEMEEVPTDDRKKRWRIPHGLRHNLPDIKAEEISALETAVEILESTNLEEKSCALKALHEKIGNTLKQDNVRRIEPDIEAMLEAEGLAVRPGPRPVISKETFTKLREAILACFKVKIIYRARTTGRKFTQIISPYGFLYGSRHYLVAQSKGYKLFSLAEIEEIEILDEYFVRDENFSINEYASQSFGVFQEPQMDITLLFSKEVANDVLAFHFHSSETKEVQENGSVLVKLRAGGKLEICWHLFTWGEYVKIISPGSLIDEMKSRLSASYTEYS